MITIQPEAKSRLLCVRCEHSEDDHNWSTGPCSVKEGTSASYPFYKTHCTCYAFVSPFSLDGRAVLSLVHKSGFSRALACGYVLNMSESEKYKLAHEGDNEAV